MRMDAPAAREGQLKEADGDLLTCWSIPPSVLARADEVIE